MTDPRRITVGDVLNMLTAKTGQSFDHVPLNERMRLISDPPMMISDAEQQVLKLLLADGNFLNLHVKRDTQ